MIIVGRAFRNECVYQTDKCHTVIERRRRVVVVDLVYAKPFRNVVYFPVMIYSRDRCTRRIYCEGPFGRQICGDPRPNNGYNGQITRETALKRNRM